MGWLNHLLGLRLTILLILGVTLPIGGLANLIFTALLFAGVAFELYVASRAAYAAYQARYGQAAAKPA